MATRVNIKGLDELEVNVKKRFRVVQTNKQMLMQIGEVSVERMKLEARRKTPLQGRTRGSFPTNYPKPSTQKARRQIARYNKTHGAYGASTPNLTITGQLVDAIRFKVTQRLGNILFFVSGVRNPYVGKNGPRRRNPSNAVVYKKLLDRNQKFRILGVDEKLQKRISNIVRRTLRRALRF